MNDSDSEYEETEYLVYADFKNYLAPHQLKHEDAAIKIIGIESETPMAEINGNFFKGTTCGGIFQLTIIKFNSFFL